MNFETDNGAVAWANWLAQFGDSPRLEALVKALYWGADVAGKAGADLYLKRWLDTARGKQLDGIGQIVGQDRVVLAGSVPFFGFDGQSNSAGFGGARFRPQQEQEAIGQVTLLDTEYRQVLQWKIAVNKGTGTAKDIADAINAVFATDGTQITDAGNAKFSIWVNVTMDPNNPLIVNKEQWVPALAGVGFTFVGFREEFDLLTEDGDELLTEDGDTLIVEYFQPES